MKYIKFWKCVVIRQGDKVMGGAMASFNDEAMAQAIRETDIGFIFPERRPSGWELPSQAA